MVRFFRFWKFGKGLNKLNCVHTLCKCARSAARASTSHTCARKKTCARARNIMIIFFFRARDPADPAPYSIPRSAGRGRARVHAHAHSYRCARYIYIYTRIRIRTGGAASRCSCAVDVRTCTCSYRYRSRCQCKIIVIYIIMGSIYIYIYVYVYITAPAGRCDRLPACHPPPPPLSHSATGGTPQRRDS